MAYKSIYAYTGANKDERTHIECMAEDGLPGLYLLGSIPDATQHEIRETVRAAIKNSGYIFPNQAHIVVAVRDTCASAKELEASIALAILAATEQIDIPNDLEVYSSELGLSGRLERGECETLRELAEMVNIKTNVSPSQEMKPYLTDIPIIDPKGHVVLETYGKDALVFKPEAIYERYVVASGYDAKTGEWSQGKYFKGIAEAALAADPNVITGSETWWQLDDVKERLRDVLSKVNLSEEKLDWISKEIVINLSGYKSMEDVVDAAVEDAGVILSDKINSWLQTFEPELLEQQKTGFIPYEKLTTKEKSLVDSPEYYIREQAAREGLGLDKLVFDEDAGVIEEVVERGYGLDQLSQDEFIPQIRNRVSKYLDEHYDGSLDKWIAENPEKCVLKEDLSNKSILHTPKPETQQSKQNLTSDLAQTSSKAKEVMTSTREIQKQNKER